jgi:hypothetical protein
MLDQLVSFLFFIIVALLFDKGTTFRRYLSTVLNQTDRFEILDKGEQSPKIGFLHVHSMTSQLRGW